MAKAKAKKSGGTSYIVASKVKELVKKGKLKCASDVVDALNHLVSNAVAKGADRAKANGRKTLRGADI